MPNIRRKLSMEALVQTGFSNGTIYIYIIYLVVIQPLSCGDCNILNQGLPMQVTFSDCKISLPVPSWKYFHPLLKGNSLPSLPSGSPVIFPPNCEAFTLAESEVPERVERVAPLRELLEDPPDEDVMTRLEVRIFQQRKTRDMKGRKLMSQRWGVLLYKILQS